MTGNANSLFGRGEARYKNSVHYLSPEWAGASAWLLVTASVLQDSSGIVNWLRGTGDQFAERSTGWVLATLNAITNTAGLLIVAWGVLRGL